jgi:hypothetical protein
MPLDFCNATLQSGDTMQPEPKYAAERLYALASALLCLEHTAGAAFDPVALGAAVQAVLVAAVRAELALRNLQLRHVPERNEAPQEFALMVLAVPSAA